MSKVGAWKHRVEGGRVGVVSNSHTTRVAPLSRAAARRRVGVFGPQPEYCFELSDDAFVDAINSAHFTRFINHDGTERANVGFDIVRRAPATAGAWVSTAADASVEFCAIADIAPGEELLFD